MALFQKKPNVTSSVPLYTVGSIKTILVIGLGNPSEEYAKTRHNTGFLVLDEFAKINTFPGWVNKKDLKCELTIANLGENRVILCKPTTFMNSSGEAAQAVQHFYRIYNPNTLAVYDELSINFGQLRARVGGSDAGHNGVKSLVQYIGDDFGRLRIGIGGDLAEKTDPADFVLTQFAKNEQANFPKIIKEASAMITEYIFSGQLPHDTRNVL